MWGEGERKEKKFFSASCILEKILYIFIALICMTLLNLCSREVQFQAPVHQGEQTFKTFFFSFFEGDSVLRGTRGLNSREILELFPVKLLL